MSRVLAQSAKQSLRLVRGCAMASVAPRAVFFGPASRGFFSTSVARFNEQTQVLNEVLSEELKFEEQDSFGLDETFKSYLENEGIEIVNTDGKVLAELLKKTSDEQIHIYFDVLKISQTSYQLKQLQEQAAENEYLEQELAELAFVDVDLVVKKNNKAVNFDLQLSLIDQTFSVSGITPYVHDAELATADDAESNNTKDVKYSGPEFTQLADELQEAVNQYLLSRGINGELAEFILAYASVKENNEYLDWLVELKEFTN